MPEGAKMEEVERVPGPGPEGVWAAQHRPEAAYMVEGVLVCQTDQRQQMSKETVPVSGSRGRGRPALADRSVGEIAGSTPQTRSRMRMKLADLALIP